MPLLRRLLIGCLVLTVVGCEDGCTEEEVCKVTAQVLPLFVEAVVDGLELPNGIDPAVEAACRGLLTSLQDDPTSSFALEVDTFGGGSDSLAVTGVGFSASLEQAIAAATPTCDDWLLTAAQDMCRRGQIGPPVPVTG